MRKRKHRFAGPKKPVYVRFSLEVGERIEHISKAKMISCSKVVEEIVVNFLNGKTQP